MWADITASRDADIRIQFTHTDSCCKGPNTGESEMNKKNSSNGQILGKTELGKSYQLFWGDIHNHNAIGYAKGSLERSIDVAREHLDFFAFTGHASWHDLPEMPGDRHMKWVNGFKVHSDHWPKTRRLIKEANDVSFVAFLGYEWHSSMYGDYCVIFPEDQPDLYLPDNAPDLLDFAARKKAFAIPHHVAYKQGWRGANWDCFRPDVTPVVEIFSEHGCTESDRAPYPMILHSNSGRSTSNTIQYQLAQGKRFGFVASTDDHFGYPGAYGEGVVGAWTSDLSSEAIFDAIRNRRAYAATGDRIRLEYTMNGKPMGAELPATKVRKAHVSVLGQDSIHMVELVRNGRVIKRYFPEDHLPDDIELPRRFKCRFQYGWGPWAALDLARTCNWEVKVTIENGRFLDAKGCFQTGPYEEDLRDRLRMVSSKEIRLTSFTSRREAYLEDPTKSLVLDIEADPNARIIVETTKPAEVKREIPVNKLLDDNEVSFTGVFTSESFIVHRIVTPAEYSAEVEWVDERSENDTGDCYYVRVRQHNGHLAWSSPVWIG